MESFEFCNAALNGSIASRKFVAQQQSIKKSKKYFITLEKSWDMIIERTAKEVIIRLPAYVDTNGLQRFVDYLSYKEATASSQAKQSDVDILAKEVKAGWWAKNRAGLLNEDCS